VSFAEPVAQGQSPPARGVLCLGEALVDLVCERPIDDLAQADAFVPHFGGAVANTGMTAARLGAPIALAGGAGDDAWGHWLRDRLVREGIDVSWFALRPGSPTPLALVRVDGQGEPHYRIYGETIASAVQMLGEFAEVALRRSQAFFFSSNTLVGGDERAVTMRAREVALELGRHVIFDPNLRLHRWQSRADAAASANACVPGALLVRCNASESELMTGEADPERAALALVKAGARLVVITRGAEGAMLRGELHADVPGVAAKVRCTMGAGDALTGVLLARLALADFYPPALAAALAEAVAAGARACERWGALE
jgi:sugar/nucleoside kinase (ribokinase family)